MRNGATPITYSPGADMAYVYVVHPMAGAASCAPPVVRPVGSAPLPGPAFTVADFPNCVDVLGRSLPPPVPIGVITDAVQELVAMAGRVFGKALIDRPPPRVELGDQSNPSVEPWASRIVLRQESVDADSRVQLLYNAAHEAQHYACLTGSGGTTWVDEMLAELFAVAVVGVLNPRYALSTAETRRRDSLSLSYRDMAAGRWGMGAPAELYGRAFVTGEQLQAEVGWHELTNLTGRTRFREHVPLAVWIAGLDTDKAAAVRRVLELPSAD